ncbi:MULTISPECIES: NAD(P)/FAD-dependent oxidoreductase [Bacillus]|uniref:Sarcosine oxidase subunit alpha n=2 Tax=Bacillus TaxID=1386 RepID=A0A0M4FXC1_9BACI|nr:MULTISPECIES: NAD(P)/FAD-dependent oxidoreductase [Bacillus]ALC81713.1 sarcosine oxidase subunit alpha [Bacillus gobiensis]MBP1080787.1 sarcosine oxidase subunit alpha [Bacillus capparidis]MED1094639.1 NAD(P)/FAD-dependent oxidoreductase [Bacillus capparidis]
MDNAIIIGSGPAGLTAAVTCAENGVDVVVIDEYMIAGGRLLGQLYEEPNGSWWNGIKESTKLYKKAVNLGVKFHLNTAVNNIEKLNGLWVVYTEKETFHTDNLLLATGAAESPVPVPGWTLPGVMSVGAAQVMTNVHRVKPGERGVIIGVNVLSAAIAMELQLAGVEVACLTLPKMNRITKDAGQPKKVLDSLLHVSHMAPSPFVRYGSKLMKNDFMKKLGVNFYPKKGVKMWGIPIQLRKAVTEIYGENEVERVTLATINADGEVVSGSEEHIQVDFVCIAGGLYPLAELAAVAGCPFYLVEELGGYVPLHNERMETPLEGLYVAGNITGIEGAKVAAAQGRTAGLSIAHRSGMKRLDINIKDSIEMTEQTRNNAHIQFHPEIEVGRKKILQQWEAYQSNKKSQVVTNV